MTTPNPNITAEEVALDFQRFMEAQGYQNDVTNNAVANLVQTDNRQQAAIDGLVTTTGNLAAVAQNHQGQITALGARVDRVEAAVQPDNLRRTVVEVHRESNRWVGLGALIGAVIGFVLTWGITAKNTVTTSDPKVVTVMVNLGVARGLVIVAGTLVGAVIGGLLLNGASSSSRTEVREETNTNRRPWWKLWQRRTGNNDAAQAPNPTPAQDNRQPANAR